jgi:hypothetical protein
MSIKAQIYFGLFAKREDVEMVMQEALPKRAMVEFAYRIGSWKHVSPQHPHLQSNTFGDEGNEIQAPGQRYFEQCMVIYSMDKRLYSFTADRSSDNPWQRQIFPKLQAARQLEQIPKYVEARVMTERWGVFFQDVYRRMLELEEMFDKSRIDDSEVDRSKLPKIMHMIPGFGVEKPSAN